MSNQLSRRDFERVAASGLLAGSVSGWLSELARAAPQVKAKGRSCILLWMNGGPSQHHTFSPAEEGNEFETIDTTVPGIRFADTLPKLAAMAGELTILRSMSTPENEHERARSLMHDGRRPIPGELYPAFGAIASKELGRADSELPNFVTIDGGTDGGNGPGFYRPIAAYLGPRHEPLRVRDPDQGIEYLRPRLPPSVHEAGLDLLAKSEQRFAARAKLPIVEAHRSMVDQTIALLRSERAKAFDLDREPEKSRAAFGPSKFGRACLLARRLIEADVPFVEVSLAGWDDHNGAAKEVKRRCQYMDGALAALLTDLKERGRLDSTLVVWMGEFGRSPGRGDGHYSKAWTAVLAGGGIKAGQAIGRTDKKGGVVTERPISAPDLLATLCRVLKIDCDKTYDTPGDRPMRIVEHGEKVVEELFG